MSFISTQVSANGLSVKYLPTCPSSFEGESIPARFALQLGSAGLVAMVSLSIEDARVLADQLPALLMAHDAAEHAAKELGIATAEAA